MSFPEVSMETFSDSHQRKIKKQFKNVSKSILGDVV